MSLQQGVGTIGGMKTWAGRLVPAGLIALSAVPLLAGGIRLNELAGGAEVTAANARFFAPLPVVAHIAAVTLYTVLGAFQFAPRFRRRRPRWHRAAGRVLVAAGLVTALSGIWMTLFSALPAGDDGLLTVFRLGFGTAMVVSIVLGFVAIGRGDVRRHRAWMTRAYAIGLGAGSQFVVQLVWYVAAGAPSHLGRALLLGAGWTVNVVVAEWIIRRRGSGFQPVGLVGPHGDLDPVPDAQLGHQAGDVTLDRTE